MGKLIKWIPGLCLLILSLPGSALRTHVESLCKPCDVNKRSQALPGKLDIKRHSPSILYLLTQCHLTLFLPFTTIDVCSLICLFFHDLYWWPILKCTVNPVLSGHSKTDKTKILMTNCKLMKVESIAECSPWSILQYFWYALSKTRSWKPIFGLFIFEWPLKTGFTCKYLTVENLSVKKLTICETIWPKGCWQQHTIATQIKLLL